MLPVRDREERQNSTVVDKMTETETKRLTDSDIDWTEKSWNPITGCEHYCGYCYAQKMATRFHGGDFSPKFHPDRIEAPKHTKQDYLIFLGSNGDTWGDWVPKDWIEQVLQIIKETPQHTYLTLTKNPKRYHEFELPSNLWVGVTLDAGVQSMRAPALTSREHWFATLHHVNSQKFVSVEPLAPRERAFYHGIPALGARWIIVGIQTPVTLATTPSREDLDWFWNELLYYCHWHLDNGDEYHCGRASLFFKLSVDEAYPQETHPYVGGFPWVWPKDQPRFRDPASIGNPMLVWCTACKVKRRLHRDIYALDIDRIPRQHKPLFGIKEEVFLCKTCYHKLVEEST